MQLPYSENYPGSNGELFKIRLTDQYSHILASINLLINDNGEEKEIAIRKNEYTKEENLETILEGVKHSINLITVMRRISPEADKALFL